MPTPDLEMVRAAMFADPGVKAVDDLRWMPDPSGLGIQATVTVASSAVDEARYRPSSARCWPLSSA